MNNQNLVSSKFLTRFAGRKAVKTATMCLIPMLLCLLIVCFVRIGIGFNIKGKEAKLANVQAAKSEYTMAQDSVTSLQAQIAANSENIQYFENLKQRFTDYDLMMDYIVKTKPSGVTIISIEDASIVPNAETATVTNKLSSEDIINGVKENLPSYVPDNTGTSNIEFTEGGNVLPDGTLPEDPNAPPTEPTPPVMNDDGTVSSELPPDAMPSDPMPVDPNAEIVPDSTTPDKYKAALFYTKDIGQGDILIRGYATQASQVSKYIVSLSKAPQISGYTIEGTENKKTQVGGVSVILFELKLSLKGGSES